MWTLTKEFKFEAAHQLPNHDGKCKRLHGHSWKGRIIVRGPNLKQEGPESGMLTDYGRIKKMVDILVEEYLDHYFLNETLKLENPTSEEIARWVYEALMPSFNPVKDGIDLVAIEIDETCTCSCRYVPHNGSHSWLQKKETIRDSSEHAAG